MKRRKQSPASAVIEASLQIALEQARIIAASNYNEDNHQPDTDGQPITDGTRAVVTQ